METGPIKEYYDTYVGRQVQAGTNERHQRILQLALDHGLRNGMRVLEVGCGVGTLTGLMAPLLQQGRLVALDMSPASIEAARSRLQRHSHLHLQVADAVTCQLEERFDLIILPDVLEHIPLDRHNALFINLHAHLAPGGKVLIHSPDPHFAEWLRTEHPELLQVVDIALHMPQLLSAVEGSGLILHQFQRHCIWTDHPDYMLLVLVQEPSGTSYVQRVQPAAGSLARLKRWIYRTFR